MCIFCEIIAGNIPCYTVYEDEKVLAFLDISQVCKGHTLVVPKQHYANFLECDPTLLQHLIQVAQMLGNHLVETCEAKGMNILSNVHEVAGQSVDHFHIHLIPRYHESDACNIHFEESEPQDLEALSKLLAVKK